MKRKTRVSPTKLTLHYLRKRGIPARVVEQYIKTPQGGFRRDLWGSDIQSLLGVHTLGIQAGIGAHHAEKIKKAMGLEDVKLWLASPTRLFQVWTWTQRVVRKKDGTKAKLPKWTPRVSQITLRDGELIVEPFILKS